MLFPIASNILALALLAAPLVAAHGKVSVATGDLGGNGTALGIQGGIIPGAGSNKVTEPDTTVFRGAAAAGCGKTTGKGVNNIQTGTAVAMALSGNQLPQVSPGGSVSGTLHIVTSDGAGPYKALIDSTGTGNFTNAAQMTVLTQVPGKKGNIKKSKPKRAVAALWERASATLMRRATNINEDFPFKVAIPAGTTCTGTVAGQSNVCMVKLVNPSKAGPFGGCIPVQMVIPAAPAGTKKARKFNA